MRAGSIRALVIRTSLGVSILAALFAAVVLSAVEGWVQDPTLRFTVARILAPNLGEVTTGVFRSGQIHRPFSSWVWKTCGFRTVVNLAWSGSPADLAEERSLSARGAVYRKFSWSPDGPPSPEEIRAALEAVDRDPRPLLIHCRAGRDRTGGLVGLWRLSHGSSFEEVERDWGSYGAPSPGWQRALRERAGLRSMTNQPDPN